MNLMKSNKFPFDHVVIEEEKMVWVKGSYPGGMAVPQLMKKHFPGYSYKLASSDYLDQLRQTQ